MTDPILILMIAFYLLGIISGIVAFFAVRKLYRLGKARIIFWDGDARSIWDVYLRPHDGKVSTGEKTFLLEGEAKNGGTYSTWVIESRTGRNLKCFTRKETADTDIVEAVLSVANPESYYRALHRHRWSDILRAGEDPDKYRWVFPVAIIALVGIMVILAFLGYIMTKLPNPAGGI